MATKAEKFLKPAIKDLTEVVLTIEKAAEDKKFSFREILKTAKEVYDLKDDILNIDQIKAEWLALDTPVKQGLAIEIAEELLEEGVLSKAAAEIVYEAVRMIFSFVRFAEIIKKYK